MNTWLSRTLTLLALCSTPLAWAGDYQWDMVELAPESGAACGDGSPYRFFVNRTPLNHNLTLVYEGGGACWDQKACLGEGRLGASNPNGIPPNYMQTVDVAFGLVTPFNARNSPQAVSTQDWNMVFLPYCTGDVHSGSKLAVYDDAYPDTPRVQHHAGQANIRAAVAWLRANLGQPEQLLLTGYSAGGVGSTTTYAMVRGILQPTGRVTLLADSGPLVPAPRGSTPEERPAILLQETIRSAWGLDEPGGLVAQYAGLIDGFDSNDLGSVNAALARTYPQDRFGFMVFTRDTNFSAFSYEKFYPDLYDAPNPVAYRQALFGRWWPDLDRWAAGLASAPNVDVYVPYFRNFNQSHCLTIIDFSGTGIEWAGVDSLSTFVENALARGPQMQLVEGQNNADFTQPLSPFMRLVKLLLKVLG
jgi:hypothetical protein